MCIDRPCVYAPFVYTYTCMYMTCIYIYVYIYICVYIHTHIYIYSKCTSIYIYNMHIQMTMAISWLPIFLSPQYSQLMILKDACLPGGWVQLRKDTKQHLLFSDLHERRAHTDVIWFIMVTTASSPPLYYINRARPGCPVFLHHLSIFKGDAKERRTENHHFSPKVTF